jgi:hypothetical protein
VSAQNSHSQLETDFQLACKEKAPPASGAEKGLSSTNGNTRADAGNSRRRLPSRRGSTIVTFEHEGRRYRASGSRFPDGRLAEIFLDVGGKAGSAVQAHADNEAILASLLLQHDVPVGAIRHSIDGPLALALDLLDGAQS